MTQTPNQRGASFEDKVETVLADLCSKHPGAVCFEHPYTLTLRDGSVVKLDFRLNVRFPHVIDEHLIECQSRNNSDQDLINKIVNIRQDSPHNRVLFVHEAPISNAVGQRCVQHGINVYPYEEFVAYVAKIGETLEHVPAPVVFMMQLAQAQPTAARNVAATPAFQPQVHKGLGNLPGISTKAGFGNSARPGFNKGR